MFGSDYPVISPDRWIASFDDLDIKPEVRPLIMKDNAVHVLGLAADARPTEARPTTVPTSRSGSEGAST
jgi:hypothetical protein